MVRVDIRIDFVDSNDVGVPRTYEIWLNESLIETGTVTYPAPSKSLVLDDLEPRTYTLTYTLNCPVDLYWFIQIWRTNFFVEEQLLGEGNVNIESPLVVTLEVERPMWQYILGLVANRLEGLRSQILARVSHISPYAYSVLEQRLLVGAITAIRRRAGIPTSSPRVTRKMGVSRVIPHEEYDFTY